MTKSITFPFNEIMYLNIFGGSGVGVAGAKVIVNVNRVVAVYQALFSAP